MAWCQGMMFPASLETMVWISQNISLRRATSVSARVASRSSSTRAFLNCDSLYAASEWTMRRSIMFAVGRGLQVDMKKGVLR